MFKFRQSRPSTLLTWKENHGEKKNILKPIHPLSIHYSPLLLQIAHIAIRNIRQYVEVSTASVPQRAVPSALPARDRHAWAGHRLFSSSRLVAEDSFVKEVIDVP